MTKKIHYKHAPCGCIVLDGKVSSLCTHARYLMITRDENNKARLGILAKAYDFDLKRHLKTAIKNAK